MRPLAAILLAVIWTACRNEPEAPPSSAVPVMPASEIKRGQDACNAYVARVCACAGSVAAMKHSCDLARALPDAINVAVDVSAGSDATRRDVLQANRSVRSIVKQCIEETAKLSAAGCP
jgi:hypothetical protein